MNTTEDADEMEDFEFEAPAVKVARLTFLGSLGFWPLFLFSTIFMLPAVAKTTAAVVERNILVDGTWFYPVAVGLAWFLSRRGVKRGSADMVCLLPWLIPALLAGYWGLYFFL